MRFIPTFKKTSTLKDWLELINKLKPQLEKHGIRIIFSTENEDKQPIYNKTGCFINSFSITLTNNY